MDRFRKNAYRRGQIGCPATKIRQQPANDTGKRRPAISQAVYHRRLCTLAAILIAALAFLAFLVIRFILLNRKLKKIIQTITEHSEQQTGFIQSISAQMEPTLDEMSKSVAGLQITAPRQAKAIQARIDALKQFGNHIQELSLLKNSLLETYEAQSFNVSSFCEKVMEQVKEDIHPDVEVTTDIPKIEIKTNAEQLQRILLHLLRNAAIYTNIRQNQAGIQEERSPYLSVHRYRQRSGYPCRKANGDLQAFY